MDVEATLAAFDAQVRRHPEVDGPGVLVEREPGVVRALGPGGGWSGITWTDLDALDADAVIAAQLARFAGYGRPWEWKHYSYDRPADLPDRLLRAGFTPRPVETLLVAETAELALEVTLPPGVQVREVRDAGDVAALVAVHDEVFGGDHAAIGRALAARLAQRPTTAAGVLAVAGRSPIAAGRLELNAGTDFASLWGGGTLPAWRGRGVFRALVAHRASVAAAAGFRYLQVDASADSRPILTRLGFSVLATTTPFIHSAARMVPTPRG